MVLEILVLVVVGCVVPATSIRCEGDTDLNDVQEYTQAVYNIGDLDFWRTAQMSFQTYGKFEGDPQGAVITGTFLFISKVLLISLYCPNLLNLCCPTV